MALTKTAYLHFLRCTKYAWLAQNRPDHLTEVDAIAQRRIRGGHDVDRLARDYFPDGVLIPTADSVTMAATTQHQLQLGAHTLFQATFAPGNYLVKVDILRRIRQGWHLIEVKASNRIKPETHIPDVAFQWHILKEAGINVKRASVMHLNRNSTFPDLTDLFVLTDITDEVQGYLSHSNITPTDMLQLLAQSQEPNVRIGRHCVKPDDCPARAHCWEGISQRTIYEISHARPGPLRTLEEQQTLYLSEIPANFDLGHEAANHLVQELREKQIQINHRAIRQALKQLIYPISFLDFEAVVYPIPKFDGTTPYQMIPFQYSCHIIDHHGVLSHKGFLHPDTSDPRPNLVRQITADMPKSGSIVVYNRPFERQVLQQLATAFPSFRAALLNLAARLWDLLPIFRKQIHDYRFGGSNSLKAILPVLVPELTYEGLPVDNGQIAQITWEEMIHQQDPELKAELTQNLHTYCELDTLAMVRILEVLQRL